MSNLIGYKTKIFYDSSEYLFSPITIVFSEAAIYDEVEKMEQALQSVGYDASVICTDVIEAAISALIEKVADRAKELGIELEYYGRTGYDPQRGECPTDELTAEATFFFPTEQHAVLFRVLMT